MWLVEQALFLRSKSRKENQSFELVFFYSHSLLLYFGLCFCVTGITQLPFGLCDDAVLCGCELLLAAGGRHVPVHTAGAFRLLWAEDFPPLSLHWLGWVDFCLPVAALADVQEENLCVCASASQFKSCTLHSLFVPNPLPCLGWRVYGHSSWMCTAQRPCDMQKLTSGRHMGLSLQNISFPEKIMSGWFQLGCPASSPESFPLH